MTNVLLFADEILETLDWKTVNQLLKDGWLCARVSNWSDGKRQKNCYMMVKVSKNIKQKVLEELVKKHKK